MVRRRRVEKSVRLTEAQAKFVEEYARELGVSQNQVMLMALDIMLKVYGPRRPRRQPT